LNLELKSIIKGVTTLEVSEYTLFDLIRHRVHNEIEAETELLPATAR